MSNPPIDFAQFIADGGTSNPGSATALTAQSDPLLLLPVRIETRYTESAAGGIELLIRIYPDQIHVDAHDPRLSETEIAAGQNFWLSDWRSGSDSERRKRVWQAFAARYGPTRAAWIAHATKPSNAEARPDTSVGDADPPAVAPVFGTVETTDRSTTPVARLLPAAWTATAYGDGRIIAMATGRPIADPPSVGPDLDQPLVHPGDADNVNHEVAPIDVGMNWLVDFAAAEAIGMALRLPIGGPVDLLLVTGLRADGSEAGAAGVADLLEAQRFSAGLGFVAPGTQTNNAEGGPSGWSSAEAGQLAISSGAAEPGTVAAQTARALGIVSSGFASLPGATASTEDELASAMVRTLWPATWGYWLTQFIGLGAGGMTREDRDWARDHAARFVRPAGPLPTLRIGRQPYGVLPVTALSRFRGDAREMRLGAIVTGLIGAGWRPAIGKVAVVGREDLANDLSKVLQGDALSQSFATRRAFGPQSVANTLDFLGRPVAAEEWLGMAARTRALTAAMGVPEDVTAAFMLHEPRAWPSGIPLIGDDPRGEINALFAAGVDDLAGNGDVRPASLLAALVRQGWLREHAQAAVRLIADPALAPDRDPEFFGFDSAPLGWAAQRARVADQMAGETATGDIAAFRQAADAVAGASADRLALHLGGILDAASHRIDAWATSLASRRLEELRVAAPTGVVVGGYGWIENLNPEPRETVEETVADEAGPLLKAPDDPGFLHAPSLHQAQVSALLRNVHLLHGGGDDDPFAISITSQRVRLAQRLFDSVRAGLGLGATLGYLVERDLHERSLDPLIDNARAAASLPGQETLPAAARRLDGLKLHDLWQANEQNALELLVLGPFPRPDRPDDPTIDDVPTDTVAKARGVLRRLGAAVDGAADLLQAEQVHQFSRGNLTASVNTLGDVDRGLAPPPDLDFIRTPRTGMAFTHRVAIVIAADAATSNEWADQATSPRASAEPALDAWLARCLGSFALLEIAVANQNGSQLSTPLSDLRLTATDFVRLASSGEAGLAELAARSARAGGPVDPASRPLLVPGRDLLDLLELGRSLGRLISVARPMDGSKLQPPHADPRPMIDIDELATRARRIESQARAVCADLETGLASSDERAIDTALVASWHYGLGNPAVPATSDAQSLRAAAERALGALAARLGPEGVTGAAQDDADALVRRAQAIMGPGAIVLPRFHVPDVEAVVASRDDPMLAGDEPLVAETWLTKLERVREPLSALGIAYREAEAMGGDPAGITLVQVPHQPGAAWNGRKASEYVDGAASLALVGGDAIAPDVPLAGLLIDEFTDVVPSKSETTGVAFRYQPPAAMAPQAILLAVPPVIDEAWTVGGLNQVLLETLELARLRAIDPEDLGLVRQFLPALAFPFNSGPDTPPNSPDVPSTNPNALH